MQISNQNNNVNFTSTPIHSVNLKKLTNGAEDGFVKAVFSKLDPNDINDSLAIHELKATWDVPYNLMDEFSREFNLSIKSHEYNAIEMVGEAPLYKRIVGLICSNSYSRNNEIISTGRVLITKPELSKKSDARSVKGVGEMLLGKAFYQAKLAKSKEFKFDSSATDFYEKTFADAKIRIIKGVNFFQEGGNDRFVIGEKDFDKYINWCQQKYQTNFSAKI